MKNNLTKKKYHRLYTKNLEFHYHSLNLFLMILFFFLSEILKNEKKFNLKNFGSFKIIQKKERVGRNPIDKKEHIIKARKVIVFKISNKLKKEINNDYSFKNEQTKTN